MGQCLAPCVKEIEDSTYSEIIHEISSFLNGGHSQVKNDLSVENACCCRKLRI